MKLRLSLPALAASVCLAASAAHCANFAGVEVPPPVPAQPVTDTHWGVEVIDPYRFLENTADPEIQKYMKVQAEATAAILDRIPGRDKLLARIKEIDADTPAVVTGVKRDEKGGRFYLKRTAGDDQFKLYWRAQGSTDKLLVDPEVNAKSTGKPHAIGGFSPSPDGRLLAYQTSTSGSEIGVMRVIDTATVKEVTPAIDRIRDGNAEWLPDQSGFFYSRLAENWEQRPRAERFMDTAVHLRRFADPGNDRVVFGNNLFPEVVIGRSSSGHPMIVPEQPLVAVIVSHGVDPYHSLYVADRKGVLAGQPKWRRIFDESARVASIAVGSGHFYLRSALAAPRYQLLRLPIQGTDLGQAETVIAASDAVIVAIGAAKEGLYVTRREGVVKRLYRLGYAASVVPEMIPLPVEGNVSLTDTNPLVAGAVLVLAGWTRAAAHYTLGAEGKAPAPMNLVTQGKYAAPADLAVREVRVKSHDGVEVPVSVISRADIKLDGRNPTILYGYGAYGTVENPAWNPRLLPWFEQGGVYVLAHVRGGGIYGDGWRRDGWKTTKPNTWKDGIAAAEWLIANGYTARERLSIYGGSAGGIFVGRAITERPELFAAASVGVGNTDSIRSETRANGAANIPEYGTVKIEDEFRGLLAMSPYANVKAGTAYPALMLEHGVNDTRVDVWMSLKMGTRVAAATSSGKPVLMRLEYEGGHGPGAPQSQLQRRTADRLTFFLWQAGVQGFQPVAK